MSRDAANSRFYCGSSSARRVKTSYDFRLVAIAALGFARPAGAHSFGQSYTLPVPFWLYAWAAAATLIASFIVAGLFARHSGPGRRMGDAGPWHVLPVPALRIMQGASLVVLALCIASGLAGSQSPYANFNMTAFWVVFLLGFAYFSAFAGDFYALVNPWRALASLVDRWIPSFSQGRRRYPETLGYAPAILLYGILVWFELFGRVLPYSLSIALGLYTALNLAAVGWVGAAAWFRYGEVFSVMFGLISRLAPVVFSHEAGGKPATRFRWQRPLSGLRPDSADTWGLLVFALFMLSATAFDGLHQAKPWVRLFWTDLYVRVFSHWIEGGPVAAFPTLFEIYRWWQGVWLLLSPAVYLAAYAATIGLMDLVTGRRLGIRALALRFLPSLLPIVIVYHAAHYYTLLLTQGPKIFALASDPFGSGWNLFGSAQSISGSRVPDVAIVWHVQVALILAGHIASVAVAHREALQAFPDRRTALLSQLPMLVLMVAFTVAGLWILAQPFEAPLGRPPV